MDKQLIIKIITAKTIIVSIWLSFNSKTKTNKKNENPAIAAADERERQSWKYVKWFIKTLQFAAGVGVLWIAVKYLFS